MFNSKLRTSFATGCFYAVMTTLLALSSAVATAQLSSPHGTSPADLLQELADFPHAQIIDESQRNVLDYQIGLGAIQKVQGAWRMKHSERKSGQLTRRTWQILDGFTSREVLDDLEQKLAVESQLLYACEGRSCGPGVQWANRIFGQRLLYGQAALQAYRVYGGESEAGAQYRILMFSAARSADRQYLHAEYLQSAPGVEGATEE